MNSERAKLEMRENELETPTISAYAYVNVKTEMEQLGMRVSKTNK